MILFVPFCPWHFVRYHFVRDILSVPFSSWHFVCTIFVRDILSAIILSMTFCPYHFVCDILSATILSIPFCLWHFVRYHFVHTILSVTFCPLPFCPRTQEHLHNLKTESDMQCRRGESWLEQLDWGGQQKCIMMTNQWWWGPHRLRETLWRDETGWALERWGRAPLPVHNHVQELLRQQTCLQNRPNRNKCITFINSNFHLNKEGIWSNVRVNVLVNVIILQCAQRFRCIYTKFSSFQLLVNEKLFLKSSY